MSYQAEQPLTEPKYVEMTHILKLAKARFLPEAPPCFGEILPEQGSCQVGQEPDMQRMSS